MSRPLLRAAVGAVAFATVAGGYVALAANDGPPIAVNDDEDYVEYVVRTGDTSVNAIGERLCGVALRSQMGAQVQALNPNLVGTLSVGEALTVPARCPSTPTTTTAPATTTTQPVTTTTAPVTTTTAPPSTTTTAPTTTTSTLPPTTSTTQPATTTTQPPSGLMFYETFASASGFYDRFDFGLSLHNAPNEDIAGPQAGSGAIPGGWEGDHSAMCSPPGDGAETRRPVVPHAGYGHVTPTQVANGTGKSQLFWWCAPGNDAAKGHVMTSTNGFGYMIGYFSPKQTFSNVSRVCWDQNTTTMDAKWINVVLAPIGDVDLTTAWRGFQDLGFDPPGFQPSVARPGIPAAPPESQGPTTNVWTPNGVGIQVQNGLMQYWEGAHFHQFESDHWYQNGDRATRYRHCAIDNGNGTITLTQDRPAQCNIRNGGMTACGHRERTVPGAFPNGEVRVVFQDDMYDPPKRAGYDPTRLTWHWDNIEIG